MNTELLKKRRTELNLTQEYIALSLGYKHKSSYCQIETGKFSIPLKKLPELKRILRLSDSDMNQIIGI